MGLSMRNTAVSFLLLLASATPAWAIDTQITLTSPADVTSRRASLINNAWNITTGILPTTLPTVTTVGLPDFSTGPLGHALNNVTRVDQYVVQSSQIANTSLLYLAAAPNNHRVVILNGGHQNTCDWTQFAAHYNMQTVLQMLLVNGYSVFAMNMPNCGDGNQHITDFSSLGDKALGAFLDPAVQAMNYWDANSSFNDYNFVGLSGGGWTCTVVPALDPRIHLSFPTAGSMPGTQFVTGASNGQNWGDAPTGNAEQQGGTSRNFYTIAGYLDLYIMGASGLTPKGKLRQQTQILNTGDSCCFGPAQWTYSGFNYQTLYSGTAQCNNAPTCDWVTYTQAYTSQIRAATAPLNGGKWSFVNDLTSNWHQIAPQAQGVIINGLEANPPVPATAGGGGRRMLLW